MNSGYVGGGGGGGLIPFVGRSGILLLTIALLQCAKR